MQWAPGNIISLASLMRAVTQSLTFYFISYMLTTLAFHTILKAHTWCARSILDPIGAIVITSLLFKIAQTTWICQGQAWKLNTASTWLWTSSSLSGIVCVGPNMAKSYRREIMNARGQTWWTRCNEAHLLKMRSLWHPNLRREMLPQPNMCILPQEALKTLSLDGMLSWCPPKIEWVASECQGSI